MAGKKNKNVNRLSELEVQEVSGVDRPANKRPFLVVKNDDGTELERDAEGNLIAPGGTPAPTEPEGPATFADLLKAIGSQLEKLEKADPIAKRLAVSDEQRLKAFKALREVMRRVDVAMSTMSMAEVDEEGSAEFMSLIANELGDVSKLLGGIARGFKPKTAKSEDSPELEAVEKAIETLTAEARAEVEKAGRKMASRRLSAFRSALKTLTSLLNELDPQEKAKTEKALTESNAKVEKLEKALDESAAEAKKLAEVVRKQAAELKKFRSARGGSNAVTVEEVSKGARDDDDDTWPLDMNQENRGAVDKSVSFG